MFGRQDHEHRLARLERRVSDLERCHACQHRAARKPRRDVKGCDHPAYRAVGDDGACIDCPQPDVDKDVPDV